VLAATALYAMFIEGPQNWQALWTSAVYLLLGATLWQARSVAVAKATSTPPAAVFETRLFDERESKVQSESRRRAAVM
jgi:hypothetical protein